MHGATSQKTVIFMMMTVVAGQLNNVFLCYSRGSRYSHHSRTPSHYSYRSGRAPSEVSTVKTKTSRKGGLVVETMAAPNPFCPNTKGICCLMLLINLGLILVTLGLVVVIQLFQPLFVWYVVSLL
jgi:hypothetical protein